MNSIEALKGSIELGGQIFLGLAEDLRDEPLTRACHGGNHAMWSVGHMAVSDRQFLSMAFGEPNPLADWEKVFAGGTRPSDSADDYPPYAEVIDAFKQSRQALLERLDTLSESDLDTPAQHAPDAPDEVKHVFGTVGQIMVIVGIHPMHHRGQLAVIRKSLQREPAIA